MPKKVKRKDDEPVVGKKEEFLEAEEHAETSDEVSESMRVSEKDVDVYTEEGREELVEADEISAGEEGFSEGAENSELAHCAACGSVMGQDEKKVVEQVRNHVQYVFCSQACAKKGARHAVPKKD